jgi:hypothetical protein
MTKYLILNLIIFLGLSSCVTYKTKPSEFIPEGFVVYKTHYGDLNNDEQEDCVVIIKGTNKDSIVVNRFDKKVDRNRRGFLILLSIKGKYRLASKNYDCFYSENEDGGNYYAPQLDIVLENGQLIVGFEHGRYGFWDYRFKYLESEFKLVEYNGSSNFGPTTLTETHINFVTKEKLFSENLDPDYESNNQIFKDTKTKINNSDLINLSEIKSFENLDMSDY